MIYVLNGSNIFMTDNRNMIFLQNKNPETQVFFESPEEALAWGCQFTTDFIGAGPCDMTVEIKDANGDSKEQFTILEPITVKATCSELFTGSIKVDISTEGDFYTESFDFVDGVAVKEISIADPGIYNLHFNEKIKTEQESFHVLHEATAFSIVIV